MCNLVAKILICVAVATSVWVAYDYYKEQEYMEVMARRERALDDENRRRELEQIEKNLDVSTISNQPGVIRYTREIPKD